MKDQQAILTPETDILQLAIAVFACSVSHTDYLITSTDLDSANTSWPHRAFTAACYGIFVAFIQVNFDYKQLSDSDRYVEKGYKDGG
jgi:hypothetical protein